jgi:taurine transport system permease protein
MSALRLLPFAVLFLIWWTVTSGLRLFPPIQLPSPESVFRYAVRAAEQGILLDAVIGSVARFLAGLVLGAALAIPLALLVAGRPRVSDAVLPMAKFFQAISGVTWIPLAVLWFGISSTASIFIIFNTTFFTFFYAMLTGVRSVSPALVQSIRTLGGGYRTVLWQVLLPGALPHLLNGLRVAIGYGWRALIASEIIASGGGLGVLIWEGQQELSTQKIVTGLLLIGAISFTMDRFALAPIEKVTIQRWGLATKNPWGEPRLA